MLASLMSLCIIYHRGVNVGDKRGIMDYIGEETD